MWRQDVVQILGDIRIYPDPDDGFIREPAVADFQAGTRLSLLDGEEAAVTAVQREATVGSGGGIRTPDTWIMIPLL